MRKIGLLGGSFNPAHRGHRRLSLGAMNALGLDEVWWLVSPGNPLKEGRSDMAPLATRLRSARAMAKRAPIRATAIERVLGTRYAVDTVFALPATYPRHRFIWLMGADLVGELHRWREWRSFAAQLPIALAGRPGQPGLNGAAPAAAWLRRFAHPRADARSWPSWTPPAVVALHLPLDSIASTILRARDPEWGGTFGASTVYDPLARSHIRGTPPKGSLSAHD